MAESTEKKAKSKKKGMQTLVIVETPAKAKNI